VTEDEYDRLEKATLAQREMPDDFCPLVKATKRGDGLLLEVRHGEAGIGYELTASNWHELPLALNRLKRSIWDYHEERRCFQDVVEKSLTVPR